MVSDKSSKPGVRWRAGIIAGVIIALYGLYPQFAVWSERGSDWNGVFASNDLDEAAYAAYLQALIDGRPRKNDPYSGRDQTPATPQHESIFSIQFAAPYAVAVPARLFGLNASQAFILVFAVAAFFTALALFWLIVQLTGDENFAAAATLAVLAGGALCAGNGLINELLGRGAAYPFLPFLRRYIPAVAFPFFFAVFALVRLSLQRERGEPVRYAAGAAAGVSFAFLVFSYFYIWTAAAAFLLAFTAGWLALRPENWKNGLKFILVTDLLALVSLIPYAWLLSRRAPDTDAVQLLVYTHAPDLFRYPLIICLAALLFLWLAVRLGRTRWRQRSTVFLVAFCLVPPIVFNQQLLTGRSLQPFHYEFYVVNYIAGLAVVLTAYLYLKGMSNRRLYGAALLVISVLAVVWGYFEVRATTRYLMSWNIRRDEAMPVAKRLAELAGDEKKRARGAVTLNYDYVQADNQPAVAPQAVLWARHQHVFAGVPWEENKKRFYQLLYYAGRDADWLREDLRGGDIEAFMALFGWDRFNARLSVNARPLTAREIEEEVGRYAAYVRNYSYRQAADPALVYAVVPSRYNIDLTNLKRWYELEKDGEYGAYILYRLRLKPPPDG